MQHPEKWRETVDPFALPYRSFTLTEVLGYPHAGNDVFQARGLWHGERVEVYIKAARQAGADVGNEIDVIEAIRCPLAPEILDYDEKRRLFVVTRAKRGERLSAIVGEGGARVSMGYLYEYGRTLAQLHASRGDFRPVKDRRFFHPPAREALEAEGLSFVHDYLLAQRPAAGETCFCHGDFHYANLLWEEGRVSAILDFDLSGWGDREFDIAWAMALRPGQRFLNTEAETERFLSGYASLAACDRARLNYYLAQIYAHFYLFSENEAGYLAYMRAFFERIC